MKQQSRVNYRSFREQNNRVHNNRVAVIAGIVFLAIGILFISIGKEKTKNIFYTISHGIFSGRAFAQEGAEAALDLTVSRNTLLSDRATLTEKVADLEAQILSLSVLRQENIKLQEMLDRIPVDRTLILGNIIAKPNQSIYDTLMIDAGTNLDVKVGAVVYARGNIAIGTVSETNTTISKIKLYSTGGEKMQGITEGNDVFIDVIGAGAGTFTSSVPRDVTIEIGSPVVVPGSGAVFAITERELSDPRDPFKKILFRSPVNLFELRYVGVEK